MRVKINFETMENLREDAITCVTLESNLYAALPEPLNLFSVARAGQICLRGRAGCPAAWLNCWSSRNRVSALRRRGRTGYAYSVFYFAALFLFCAPAQATWLDHWEKIPAAALPQRTPDGDLKAFRLALERQSENCREWRGGKFSHCGNEAAGPALECDEPALLQLTAIASAAKNWQDFFARAKPAFDWYRYKGNVLFTGYNSPLFPASLQRTERFAYPLYAPPADLAPGRLDRKAIELEHALEGKGLEIAWLSSPADVLRLQIEGSGVLKVGRKKIGVNYAAKNGFPYVSIFKLLKGKVPGSFPALTLYAEEHPAEFREALAKSPSYVFFRLANEPPCGTARVHVTGGHSLAVDPTQMPLGSAVFLAAERPREGIDPEAKIVPTQPFSRFAFAQDTGGAIKRAHVDIYFGTNPYAMLASNSMQSHGRLFLLRTKSNNSTATAQPPAKPLLAPGAGQK